MPAIGVTRAQRDALRRARRSAGMDTPAELLDAALRGSRSAITALIRYWPDNRDESSTYRVRLPSELIQRLREQVPTCDRVSRSQRGSASAGITVYIRRCELEAG